MDESKESKTFGLTPKQQLFCHEFLLDLNGCAAYRRSGYSATSKSAIAVSAHQLLRNPNVQAYLAVLREERRKQADLEADDVIAQLKAIAFSNISNYVETFDNEDCILKPMEHIDDVSLSAVQSISVRGGRVHLKMHDKSRALATLTSILGLDNDFSKAIITLANYGLKPYKDADGKWQIKDENIN